MKTKKMAGLFALLVIASMMFRGCGAGSADEAAHGIVIPASENTDEQNAADKEDEPAAPEEDEPETVPETAEEQHKHNMSKETVQKASCSSTGSVRYFCTDEDCEHEYFKTIRKLPHTPGEWVFLAGAEGGHYESHLCSVCGQNMDIRFIADTIPEGDGEGKEEKPSEDGGSSKEHTHTYGGGTVVAKATCEKEGLTVYACTGCGKVKTEAIPATGHDWDDGEVTKEATCTEEGEITYHCRNDKEHVKTKSVKKTDHAWDEGTVVKAPGCTEDGETVYTCSACGTTETKAVPAIGHQYDDGQVVRPAACEEEGAVTFTCTVCADQYTKDIPATGHDWDDGTLTKEATCAEEGEITYTCKNDNAHTKTEIVEKSTDHTWDEGAITKAANCTENGVRTYVCTVCSGTKTEVINATGHNYSEGIVTVEPECERPGVMTYLCLNDCGDSYTEEIPAIGHDYERSVIREASCEENGEAVYICKNNAAHTYSEEIPATGHDEGEWKTVREADYTQTGLKELRCTACGKLLDTEEIPVIPHECDDVLTGSGEATCESAGYETYTCSICGKSHTEVIPALGHSYEWKTVKEATCTESGTESNTCTKCGDVSESRNIDAKGHMESDWITDSEPGCTSEGSRHTSCTVCGQTMKTEAIPAIGHNWGSLIVDVEATEEAEGEGHYTCANCGETKTVTIEKAEPHAHDYSMTDSKEPTCTEEGYETYTCSICGTSYTNPVAKLAHTPGDWETESEATEEAEGKRVQRCTVCGGTVNTETIPKLPHTHNYTESDRKEAGCEEDGYIKYTCSCGDSYETVLAKTGHEYEESERTEPTCENDGSITYICRHDASHVKTDIIKAIGHNYVETARTKATCEEDGLITRTCENCQDVTEEVLEKLGHNYEVIEEKPATCTQNGYRRFACANCGDSYTEETDPMTGHSYEWVVTVEPKLGVPGEECQKCTVCGMAGETKEIPMLMTDGTDHVYYVCTGHDDAGEPVLEMVIGHFDNEAPALIAEKVNALRREKGLKELTIVSDGSLQDFAKVRATEIAWEYMTTGNFTHVRPTDSSSVSTAWRVGENIVLTGEEGDSVVIANDMYELWYNSQTHYNNMVYTGYTDTSVAVFAYKIGSYYYYYGVQNFSQYSNWSQYKGDPYSLIGTY